VACGVGGGGGGRHALALPQGRQVVGDRVHNLNTESNTSASVVQSLQRQVGSRPEVQESQYQSVDDNELVPQKEGHWE
jgi:hypothetical protein